MKICVVTGSRAEYGLFKPLLEALKSDDAFELQLVATAMHLSPTFGSTYQEIEADGFTLDAKVDMLLASDSEVSIAKSVGIGTFSIAEALSRLAPDSVMLLGDRFETLAAAQAAMLQRIPVLHIHGGEITEGAVDDAIRHAITKMSYLHFASTDEYRNRIIQLGEHPDRVFNVGALGAQSAANLLPLSNAELESDLGIGLKRPLFLSTYHPETLADRKPHDALQDMLDTFAEFPQATIVLTYPNADAAGQTLIPLLERFAEQHQDRVSLNRSLGQKRYLSLLQYADVVVGNSSSGIIEAPSLGTPTVNIGARQDGRVMADSVVCCEDNKQAIVDAIQRCLSKEFQSMAANVTNPYGQGDTCQRIVDTLKRVQLGSGVKQFHDLDPH
ncbi:MAG: UDP-N-acetylglucosamine 2-epimerase [Pseudomonadales bacterium]